MQQLFISLQKWLVPRKIFISRVFLAFELALVSCYVLLAIQLSTGAMEWIESYDWGRYLGWSALFFYTLSLIPGMLSRLRWQPILGASLMLFRRHFGIMMFISVLGHFLMIQVFPVIFGGFPIVLMSGPIAGFIAFLIAIPLWVTSNDLAEHSLGKWWKMIHKLTYVILLLVFAHLVLLMKNRLVFVPGTVIVLELISWAVFWRNKRKAAAITPSSTSAAPPPVTPPVTPLANP